MKLFDILKQFKTIKPDAHFTAHSKAEILMSPRPSHTTIRGVFVFLRAIETSAAVILAGFFILVLTGSFSGTHSIAPIQYAVIDPDGLHAEAQAIDIQIQLANIEYPQTTSTAKSKDVLTPAVVANPSEMSSTAIAAATATASSSPSSSISIDQALQELSQ